MTSTSLFYTVDITIIFHAFLILIVSTNYVEGLFVILITYRISGFDFRYKASLEKQSHEYLLFGSGKRAHSNY